MPDHPTGTVTFLFTDIEGSTPLWEQHPKAMQAALGRHDELLRARIEEHDGRFVKTTGDGVHAVFSRAEDGLACALAAQRDLKAERWESPIERLPVRMGLHTGTAELRAGDYYGSTLNLAARLEAAAHGGQVLLSETTRDLVRATLPDGAGLVDLGLHQLKGFSRPERIYQLVTPDLPLESRPLRTSAQRRHNLPEKTTPLIGREKELADLRALLTEDPDRRLVSLVGPGGIGKTRLAVETAAAVLGQFPDGAFFVPLAALGAVEHILPALAKSLDLRFHESAEPRQQLLDTLRSKKLLLVMDNFEHLLAGSDLVTRILSAAPGVRILVTTRERLRISDETLYQLGGLAYPAGEALPVQQIADYGAVKLLLHRATLARPDLAPSEQDMRQAARICRLVQGMPLAIILATAWLEMLSLSEIADEIQDSLDFLESDMRDLPERHRSMRAAFNYSWNRLAAEERAALMKLSIFRGGFSRRAAREVAGAGLRSLRNLVNKSLVSASGANRYEVHELLRQFAEQRLEGSGEAGPARDAHCDHYLNAIHRREEDLKGGRQLEALNEVEEDLDNVRLAWNRALEQENVNAIDRALDSLVIYSEYRFRYREAEDFFQSARRRFGSLRGGRFWGRLLARRAYLQARNLTTADLQGIRVDAEEALEIARRREDQAEIAFALLALGSYHVFVGGNYEVALKWFEEALDAYKQIDDNYYLAKALHRVGYAHANIGNLSLFTQFTRQGLALARQSNNRAQMTQLLYNLASAAIWEGDYALTGEYIRESIASGQEVGDPGTLAHALAVAAQIHFLSGDIDMAWSQTTEVLGYREVAYPITLAYTLSTRALAAAVRGDSDLALQLGSQGEAEENNVGGIILIKFALSLAHCGLAQLDAAQEYIEQGLALSLQHNVYHWILGFLPPAAVVLARKGQAPRAVELLGLFDNLTPDTHGWAEKWDLLADLRVELVTTLGEQGYQGAWTAGRALDLVETGSALAAELKQAT